MLRIVIWGLSLLSVYWAVNGRFVFFFLTGILALAVGKLYHWANALKRLWGEHQHDVDTLLRREHPSNADPTSPRFDAEGEARLQAWMAATVAAVDVETTGLSTKNDRVIEVAVVVARGSEILQKASWLVNPQRLIPDDATCVNGIRNADVANSPTFDLIADELTELLDGVDGCIAYNAAFDRSLLLAEFGRLQISTPAILREFWSDPLPLARKVFAGETSHKLGDTARRLGIEQEREHRAADDAMTALRIWHALIHRAPSLIPEAPISSVTVDQDVRPIATMVTEAWISGQDVRYIRTYKNGSRKILITKVPGLYQDGTCSDVRRRRFRQLTKDLV